MAAEPPRLRVLVVEDDPRTASAIVRALRALEVDVELASTEAGALAALDGVDLAVVDMMRPDGSGEVVLRALASRGRARAIVLSAGAELSRRLASFELGAVDFVAKPFFLEELMARVRVWLGPRSVGPRRVIEAGRTELDLDAGTVCVDGVATHLTRTEHAILTRLVERAGETLYREELVRTIAAVRPTEDTTDARALDSHVSRLRRKLGELAPRLRTVWGIGYCFDRERRS